ncbi:MAG: hypothetical protein ACRDJH_21660 [Thermomicrobiales bacterium]
MQMTDFGNSYMTWVAPHDFSDRRVPGHKPWGNSARILIDARCTITDDATGTTEELYLVAPCRTEWMYQEENLFQNPSGEYRVIFTQERQLVVGKRMVEESDRPGSSSTDKFTSLVFTIGLFPDATALDTGKAVVAATHANLPINALTEIRDDASGLRATLEYPVRTMNIHPERERFQVDTGPLIFPDLAANDEHWIDRCALAHVIYNTFDRAEFICKRPTPFLHDGQEVARIFHYSDYRALPATHTLYVAGRL